MNEKRKNVFAIIDDAVANMLYYDRKEDGEMPIGEIENMVFNKQITVKEMAKRFELTLQENIE